MEEGVCAESESQTDRILDVQLTSAPSSCFLLPPDLLNPNSQGYCYLCHEDNSRSPRAAAGK